MGHEEHGYFFKEKVESTYLIIYKNINRYLKVAKIFREKMTPSKKSPPKTHRKSKKLNHQATFNFKKDKK